MATQMGWAFLFAPTGAFTLEANVLFNSYANALAYAKTDATALVGKVISVVNDGVYTIEAIGENAVLKKVGADIDLTNYVTKDQISSIFTYKGSVDKYTDLPKDAAKGDVWNIKTAFEIEDELGNKQNFPAGTNVAFDGEGWDTLAGEIDLSAYSLKSEVTTLETNLTTAIGGVASDLALTNAEVAKKVEKVEGSSLITTEKLTLIDTNAANIQALEDKNLDSRISTLEGMFKDGENNIDLSSINTSISDHSSRIGVLEGDNTNNKAAITTLQGQVQGHGGRLTAIENLNTEQSNLIGGLTTRVETVEAYGTSITNLTGLVNGHTESISTLTTGVNDAKALATSEAEKAEAAAKQFATDEIGKLSFDEAGTAETLANKALADAKEDAAKLYQPKGNYEVAGTAAGLNKAMDDRVKVLEAIDHDQLAKDAAASAVATVVDNAPEAFNTLKEIAEWIADNDHADDVLDIQNRIKAIEDDYLTSADKTAIEQIITDNEKVTAEALNDLDSRVDELEAKKTIIDSALQATDITSGSANGTIAVKGTDVAVKGLGSAAFTAATAYATAAQGAKADVAAPQATTYTKDEVNALLEWEEVE